jgi:iron(III) transport system permease protein
VVLGVVAGLPLAGLGWRAGRVAGEAAAGVPPRWSGAGLAGTLARAVPDLLEPSPLAVILPAGGGLEWMAAWLTSPLAWTLLWGGVAALLATALAWWLAWRARGCRSWRALALVAAVLALATPGPVAGMALKLAYLRVPAVHDTAAILMLALALRALPYALLILLPALGGLPEAYLDAARLDGLGPGAQAWRVAWPLTQRHAAAALGVSLLLAMGELPASNIVLPPGQTTLAVRLWGLLHTGVESHLAGVGLLLVGVYAILGGLAARVLGRLGGSRGG